MRSGWGAARRVSARRDPLRARLARDGGRRLRRRAEAAPRRRAGGLGAAPVQEMWRARDLRPLHGALAADGAAHPPRRRVESASAAPAPTRRAPHVPTARARRGGGGGGGGKSKGQKNVPYGADEGCARRLEAEAEATSRRLRGGGGVARRYAPARRLSYSDAGGGAAARLGRRWAARADRGGGGGRAAALTQMASARKAGSPTAARRCGKRRTMIAPSSSSEARAQGRGRGTLAAAPDASAGDARRARARRGGGGAGRGSPRRSTRCAADHGSRLPREFGHASARRSVEAARRPTASARPRTDRRTAVLWWQRLAKGSPICARRTRPRLSAAAPPAAASWATNSRLAAAARMAEMALVR